MTEWGSVDNDFGVAALAIAVILFLIVVPGVVALNFVDRKLAADLQARIGPNRAGWRGVLQPLADFLKLAQKNGGTQFSIGEAFWAGLAVFFLFSNIGAVPLSRNWILFDAHLASLLPVVLIIAFSFSLLLLGLGQATVNGWFGGLRGISQTVVGIVPVLMSLMTVGLLAGDLSWTRINGLQSSGISSWTVFQSPFAGIAFVVFVLSGLIALGQKPFDANYSSTDLHGGVLSNLYGKRLVIFRLIRGYGLMLWLLVSVHLFLGGWSLPFGVDVWVHENVSSVLATLLDILVIAAKVLVLAYTVFWVARVNPRPRADQITDFAWKYLATFAVLSLAGSFLWKGVVSG
jgi:NADH-quinone oxidoreductase subunit H